MCYIYTMNSVYVNTFFEKFLFFTGCGEEKPMKTYEYEEVEVLSFSAEQLLVYENRVEI